jgi:hypothetical protein
MIKILIKEEKEVCPPATQNVELNLKNRQHAIDEYGYGPPNPQESNEEFWAKKAEMWNVQDLKQVKTMRCGNCAAFNISKKMLNCISKGLSGDVDATEEAGKLGYCQMFKFKCASARTCDAWVTGGPIK